MKLLIVGGGYMGTALSQYFSKYTEVTLYEQNPAQVERLKSNQKLQHVNIVGALTQDIETQIVIEAIPEKLDLKQQLFSQLEAMYPEDVIFCTNTSSFLISDVAENLTKKSRFIGTHFFSPADIIPLVEVVPSSWTSTDILQKVMQFLKDTQKKPVALKQEIEGFIANRLQSALAREAMSLVEKGIVSPDDVDTIARWSIGIRLPFTGPMEQRDLNGLDTHLAINEYVYPTLENTVEPLEIIKNHVANNELGVKTGKGFYDWEEINVDEYLKQKNQTLEKLITIMNSLKEERT